MGNIRVYDKIVIEILNRRKDGNPKKFTSFH